MSLIPLFFLRADSAKQTVVYNFDLISNGKGAINHAIEALDVPHPELDQSTGCGQLSIMTMGWNSDDVVDVDARMLHIWVISNLSASLLLHYTPPQQVLMQSLPNLSTKRSVYCYCTILISKVQHR